jgi:hypothetical protein
MKETKKSSAKVFFTIDPDTYKKFEIYCDDNFISKSKIVEGLMKLLIDKPLEINDLLKNNK